MSRNSLQILTPIEAGTVYDALATLQDTLMARRHKSPLDEFARLAAVVRLGEMIEKIKTGKREPFK